MHRRIYLTVFLTFYGLSAVLGRTRILDIARPDKNAAIPVWIHDEIEIVARLSLVFNWTFNNVIVAALDPTLFQYNYPNTSLLTNVSASVDATDSYLNLGNVNRIYTGTYGASGNTGSHELNMTVHGDNCTILFIFLSNICICRS